MTTIDENRTFYNQYDWRQNGEEWADIWGGSDMQWYGTILPRIHSFLPATRIVEIGAGHGRWVPYLATYGKELMLFDITESCVSYLQEKFANSDSIVANVSDGITLPDVQDHSIDLVFSFHSLVHANVTTMNSYVKEIGRVLTDDGVAFIHHSNAAAYADQPSIDPALLADYRDPSVSSEVMRNLAHDAGLVCVSQEEINWETRELLDCFSVIARPMSLWGRSETKLRNPDFTQEIGYWGQLASVYSMGRTRAVAPTIYNMELKEE